MKNLRFVIEFSEYQFVHLRSRNVVGNTIIRDLSLLSSPSIGRALAAVLEASKSAWWFRWCLEPFFVH